MKIYSVMIQYDYECNHIYGFFSSEQEAHKHKKELEDNADEFGILGGVYIGVEELDNPIWDVFKPEEDIECGNM